MRLRLQQDIAYQSKVSFSGQIGSYGGGRGQAHSRELTNGFLLAPKLTNMVYLLPFCELLSWLNSVSVHVTQIRWQIIIGHTNSFTGHLPAKLKSPVTNPPATFMSLLDLPPYIIYCVEANNKRFSSYLASRFYWKFATENCVLKCKAHRTTELGSQYLIIVEINKKPTNWWGRQNAVPQKFYPKL